MKKYFVTVNFFYLKNFVKFVFKYSNWYFIFPNIFNSTRFKSNNKKEQIINSNRIMLNNNFFINTEFIYFFFNKVFFNSRNYQNLIINFINNSNFINIFVVRFYMKGIGYRFQRPKFYKISVFRTKYLKVELGYSSYVFFKVPDCVGFKHERYKLVLFSFNRFILNTFSSYIYSLRIPDVYKGKGIRIFQESYDVFKPGKKRLIIFLCMTNVTFGRYQIYLHSTRTDLNDTTIFRTFKNVYGFGSTKVDWFNSNIGYPSRKFKLIFIFSNQTIDRVRVIRNKYNYHFQAKVGEELRIAVVKYRRLLLNSGSFRGIRFKLGLPVRGQRTKTNSSISRRLNGKII